MADGHQSAADVSLDRTHEAMDHLFRLPRAEIHTVAIAGLALLAGALVAPAAGPVAVLRTGVLLFLVPALAAGAFGYVWHRTLGGTIYLRRALFLSVVTLAIEVGILAVAWGARSWIGVPPAHAFVLASAAPLWIRHLAVVGTADPRSWIALPDVILPYALGLVLLPAVLPVAAGTWILAGATGALFLGVSVTVVAAIRAQGRAEIDGDLVELNHALLRHISEGGRTGNDPLETFLRRQGVDGAVRLGVAVFHVDDDPALAVVVPGAHPGPFGTIGGSDLPRRLREALDPLPVVTLHGACTHAENPVDRQATERVIDAIEALVEDVDPTEGARRPVRVPGAALAHPVGDAVWTVHVAAPDRWDDVDPPTGIEAEEAAQAAGAERALFADAHHSGSPGTSTVRFPSLRSEEIIDAAGDATGKALAGEAEELRVGHAARRGFGVDDGVGPEGVRCIAVAAGDHVTAYLVFDGNNMRHGVRDEIRDAVLDRVDEAEVLTTDNHVVNMGLDGYNPVGRAHDGQEWAGVAQDLVDEAVADLEPATCGSAKTRIPVRVFGVGTAERIGALINVSTAATLRLMQISIVLSLGLGGAITLLAGAVV